jgi:hypothetical protein
VTTFEKCQVIRRVIVNRAAEVMAYTNWEAAFAVQQIRDIPADLLSQNPELGDIQPSELTDAECESLGFCRWSKENPMRLIPLWLFPFLAGDVKTATIDGEVVMCKADMDNDHRFGCLAYGVVPCDVKRDIAAAVSDLG